MIEPRPWNRQATTIGSFVPRYPTDAPARIERHCERCGARLRRGNKTPHCDPCTLRARELGGRLILGRRCAVCGADTLTRTRAYCDECRPTPSARARSRPKRHLTPPLCACGSTRESWLRADGSRGYRGQCGMCRKTRRDAA